VYDTRQPYGAVQCLSITLHWNFGRIAYGTVRLLHVVHDCPAVFRREVDASMHFQKVTRWD
jgi:hypothetical protein